MKISGEEGVGDGGGRRSGPCSPTICAFEVGAGATTERQAKRLARIIAAKTRKTVATWEDGTEGPSARARPERPVRRKPAARGDPQRHGDGWPFRGGRRPTMARNHAEARAPRCRTRQGFSQQLVLAGRDRIGPRGTSPVGIHHGPARWARTLSPEAFGDGAEDRLSDAPQARFWMAMSPSENSAREPAEFPAMGIWKMPKLARIAKLIHDDQAAPDQDRGQHASCRVHLVRGPLSRVGKMHGAERPASIQAL